MGAAYSQRFGYIDSKKVIEQVPEYKAATAQLDKAVKEWQGEVDRLAKEITDARQQIAADEILLEPEMRAYKLEAVAKKEQQLRELKARYFGYEGELFLLRYELMRPIQEQVFELIEKMARRNRLEFVFDKSSNIIIVYADTRHNFTGEVVKLIKPEEDEGGGQEGNDQSVDGLGGGAEAPKPEAANRLGYIVSSDILKKMPQYAEVQQEMERQEKRWVRAIEKAKEVWQTLLNAYKAEEVKLTEDMKAERWEEVEEAKQVYLNLNNELFGPEGQVFTRRMELIKPLQDKIFEVTKELAEERGLQFIFDKTDDVSMAFADPVYNFTDFVLEKMELGDPADLPR